jgi:hypothetical protein
MLDIIDRNPGIEAAADDLYEVAAKTVAGSSRERQRSRETGASSEKRVCD